MEAAGLSTDDRRKSWSWILSWSWSCHRGTVAENGETAVSVGRDSDGTGGEAPPLLCSVLDLDRSSRLDLCLTVAAFSPGAVISIVSPEARAAVDLRPVPLTGA